MHSARITPARQAQRELIGVYLATLRTFRPLPAEPTITAARAHLRAALSVALRAYLAPDQRP